MTVTHPKQPGEGTTMTETKTSKAEAKRLTERERDQRKHIRSRINAMTYGLGTALSLKGKPKETADIKRARAKVKAFDDRLSKHNMGTHSDARRMLRDLEERVLFGDPKDFLPELRRLEAIAARHSDD